MVLARGRRPPDRADGRRRLKVLHLSKFYPPVMGGIESVASELVHGLRLRGVVADVLCSNQRSRTEQVRLPDGTGLTRVASWGTLLSMSVAPTMLAQLRGRASGYDLVHVHMPDPLAALAVWVARPAARVVLHWHSDVVRQRLALRLYEPLQRWLLERADAVVATSPPYAEASPPLSAWAHKVHVVPIGITDIAGTVDAAAVQAVRRRFGGRPIVFALGRMTYYKGFEVLIEAASRLQGECVVVIGGDGDRLAGLRAGVRLRGLGDRVQLVGHIPDDELAAYFAACEVFCLPSTVRAEAYGVAMVEAMMMSRAVVATDIPGSGVPWVNQHGVSGLNVPATDPAALASALQQLLDNGALRAACGARARARFEREFGAAEMVERTLQLYRRLLTP
jgi:glycosyltransferase involved in cell wall biosynthesis